MYKNYLKRKIALLVSEKLKEDELNYLPKVNKDKEMEIIVWLRLQEDSSDKPQMIDFMRTRFNVSDVEALRIFETAFPDGLTLVEEKALEKADIVLQESPEEKTGMIDEFFSVISATSDITMFNHTASDKETINKILKYLAPILKERHLIYNNPPFI